MTEKEISKAYDLEQRFKALLKEIQNTGLKIRGKFEKYNDIYCFEFVEEFNEFNIYGYNLT